MVLVAPSLLSANVAALGEEVQKLEVASADWLHFDVMDGHFVNNMTYGPLILKKLKSCTKLPFDVHLMVEEPERFVPWFAEAGADILTFHIEATSQPDLLIKKIKQYGIKAGISLRPGTDMQHILSITENPDLILIMGVEPGFGGQAFRQDTPERIAAMKRAFNKQNTLIEVDGGITEQTAPLCITAGADILVAGTAVFKSPDYAYNIRKIRGGV